MPTTTNMPTTTCPPLHAHHYMPTTAGLVHCADRDAQDAAATKGVNMCRLYSDADPFRILRTNEALQKRIEGHRVDIYSNRRSDNGAAPASTFQLFQDVVGPFLADLSPAYAQILKSASSRQVLAHDLFIWAIIMGDAKYMLFWWTRVEHPLRLVLIGAHVVFCTSTWYAGWRNSRRIPTAHAKPRCGMICR